MSSSLFSSKQHKSTRNLKKLLILSPLSSSSHKSPTICQSPTFTSTLSFPVVVLKVKYDFSALDDSTMSVRAHEYLKLVERPGNGWLLVQPIDRNARGYIPALYVEIAVNDPNKPVTVHWLTQVNAPENSIAKYLDNVSVSAVLLAPDNRYWYRLDIHLRNRPSKYVAKYFHEFCHLHDCLREEFGQGQQLPELSNSLRFNHDTRGPLDRVLMAEMLRLRDLLDNYIKELLKSPAMLSHTLFDFLCAPNNKCVEQDSQVLTDGVNDKLHKNSINVREMINPRKKLFSPTAPLPPVQRSSQVSHSHSSLRIFDYSNTKYLLYLNQNTSQPLSPLIPTVPCQTAPLVSETKEDLVRSKSSQTIDSFTSLFASYEISEEEDLGMPRREKSSATTKTQERSDSSFNSDSDSRRTLMSRCPSSSFHLSNYSAHSILSNGSKNASHEPHTPVMDHANFDSPIEKDDAYVIEEEPDYFRPLEPKMHKEMTLDTPFVFGERNTESKHSRWEILPRNPARQTDRIYCSY